MSNALRNADWIDVLVQESIKSALVKKRMQEQEAQQQTAAKVSPQPPANAPSTAPEQPEQADYDSIVQQLNAIRSGKSFRDTQIESQLRTYIDSELDAAERSALLKFAKGIAQIATGQVPAQQAVEPSDATPTPPVTIKSEPKVVKTIKPNVIQKNKSSSSIEDTSAPVTAPIQAKQR